MAGNLPVNIEPSTISYRILLGRLPFFFLSATISSKESTNGLAMFLEIK